MSQQGRKVYNPKVETLEERIAPGLISTHRIFDETVTTSGGVAASGGGFYVSVNGNISASVSSSGISVSGGIVIDPITPGGE